MVAVDGPGEPRGTLDELFVLILQALAFGSHSSKSCSTRLVGGGVGWGGGQETRREVQFLKGKSANR